MAKDEKIYVIKSISKYIKNKFYAESLKKLYDNLVESEDFKKADNAFPVYHGQKHIDHVISNICMLLDTVSHKHLLDEKYLYYLFAAAMIHDLGMVKNYPMGQDYLKIRLAHANANAIREFAYKHLCAVGMEIHADTIISIAAAHAEDEVETDGRTTKSNLSKKMNDVLNNENETDHNKIKFVVLLLRIADYLDIGFERLISEWKKIPFSPTQGQHIQKHMLLAGISINKGHIILDLMPSIRSKIINCASKCSFELATIRSIHSEIEDRLEEINRECNTSFSIEALPQKWFGQLCPRSSNVKLFRQEFTKAINEHKDDGSPFIIEMMGHSLYGRFCDNKENLNNEIQELLLNKYAQCRILLLDPYYESQQSCEILKFQYDENVNEDNNTHRQILPLRNREEKITDNGDILSSLHKIDFEWKPLSSKFQHTNSSLGVRLTSRLMYAGIVRFGNRMIVTPYGHGGLFASSISMVLTPSSPLFQYYKDEFQKIWNDTDQTRLYIHSQSNKFENPLKRHFDFTSKSVSVRKNSQEFFNYKSWIAKKHKERIKCWIEGKTIPPYELEIQPSPLCNLTCNHCIGSHVGVKPKPQEVMNYNSIKDNLNKALTWTETVDGKSFQIESIRISGLTGDPLYNEDSTAITKAIVNLAKSKKKKTVLFTNGVNLDKTYDFILDVDYIYVSIDAGSEKTFEDIKGHNSFNHIIDNVKHISSEIANSNTKKSTLGIGYVVTQENSHEINQLLKILEIKGIKADYLRLKRDIRESHTISPRTWYDIIEKFPPNTSKLAIEVVDAANIYPNSTHECWAKYFCLTIGPDGGVYLCDHLSSINIASIGNFNTTGLDDILKHYSYNRQHCFLCPSFNTHINQFAEELYRLKNCNNEWYTIFNWIDNAQPITQNH